MNSEKLGCSIDYNKAKEWLQWGFLKQLTKKKNKKPFVGAWAFAFQILSEL